MSNLPFVSKLIEECVIRQLSSHMVTNGLGEVLQSAYKANHSTKTALMRVFDEIYGSLDSNKAVFMALLDLSAAFDTVDHQILQRRLEALLGVRESALNWFVSYLSERTMQVLVNGVKSVTMHLDCSVPQGSKLGPRLFSDYTMPLGALLRTLLLLFHFYADDSQLLKIVSLLREKQLAAASHLENSIRVIADWMRNNKLKLNPTKTEFIVFSSSRNASKSVVDSLKLEDGAIHSSDRVRNLGVTMDSNLDMRAQVASVRKSCYFYISWIKQIRHVLSESDTKALVHALVISRLDYCNGLYHGLPSYLLHDLQMIMNDCARLVKNVKRDPTISVTKLLQDLHWLPVAERSKFKILTLVYKGVHGVAPVYISDMISRIPVPERPLRNYDELKLSVPRYRNKYGERRFSVSGPCLWNTLPYQIRSQPNLYSFKRELKTFLFRNYYDC